ncbi:hypothetical protein Acr_05g0009160 [Actinidia rufa]|uniref:Uncharacterized protein n=1 Tax=Actinidia rufa TaxID=165716 RepID=A0A7J0ENZ0_9ERIC|nr:hypothetical protein Acr_05g0009160 [Actinidia rufa]
MTQGDLDHLRETCSFPLEVRMRIPRNGETILSADDLRWFEIGEGGHFKIPVVLDSRTFHKYFTPGQVEMSSSSGGMAEGDIGTKPRVTSRAELLLLQAMQIFAGVILPANKENVENLTFDQVVTKFLVLSQEVILGTSLTFCSRDFAKSANNHYALAESSEHEMVRAQNRAIELEGVLAEASVKEKKVAEEIEAGSKEVARLESRVAELEKKSKSCQGEDHCSV